MKLYELNRFDKFKIIEDTMTPPFSTEVKKDEVYTLSHVDGMYSLCRDSAGSIVHPAAWTVVERVNE